MLKYIQLVTVLVKTVKVHCSAQIDLSSLTQGYFILKVVSGNNNYAVKFINEYIVASDIKPKAVQNF